MFYYPCSEVMNDNPLLGNLGFRQVRSKNLLCVHKYLHGIHWQASNQKPPVSLGLGLCAKQPSSTERAISLVASRSTRAMGPQETREMDS